MGAALDIACYYGSILVLYKQAVLEMEFGGFVIRTYGTKTSDSL